MAIQSQADQVTAGPRYLAIGDSFFERATMPDLCGRKPVNAGIGYATVATMIPVARGIADRMKPDFIVIGLGANDALLGRDKTFGDQARRLLATLHGYRILWIPVTPSPRLKNAGAFNQTMASLGIPIAPSLRSVQTSDGLHLTARAYLLWKYAIVDGAERTLCRGF